MNTTEQIHDISGITGKNSRLASTQEIYKARNLSHIAGIPYREALAITVKRADRMVAPVVPIGDVRKAVGFFQLPVTE